MMKKNRRTRRRSSGNGARKHLAFERLEARQLLAGDLFSALGAVAVSNAVDAGFSNPASIFAIQQSTSDQTALESALAPGEQTTGLHIAGDGDLETIPVLIGDDGSRAVDPSNGLGFINPGLDLHSLQGDSPEAAPPNYEFVPLPPTIYSFEPFATTASPLTPVGLTPVTVLSTELFSEPLPTGGPADLAPISITVSTGIAPALPADEIGLEPTNYQYFKPSDQSVTSETAVGVVRTGLLAPYQSFGLLPNKDANSPETVLDPATQSPSPRPTAAAPGNSNAPVTGGQISPVTQTKEVNASEAVVEFTNGVSLVAAGGGYGNAELFETVAQTDAFTVTSASYSAIANSRLARVLQRVVLLPEQDERSGAGSYEPRLAYPDGALVGVDWNAKTSDDDVFMSLETAVFFAVLGGIQTQQPSEKPSERRRESFQRKF